MKRKFSLNALLHNERAMMVISAVAAVLIWALVSFGPGNIQDRTLSVTHTVDLTGTIAGYNDLRVIGEDTFTVRVKVEGARSVIFNLNPEDIAIRPEFSDIQGAGTSEVALKATKVKAGDYAITSISPATVTLNCDYWTKTTLPLTTDITSISVKDEKTQQIGDLRIESAIVSNGSIVVEGPQSTVSHISSVLAVVKDGGAIQKTSRFVAALKAFDAEGKELDISNCTFEGANANNTVDITVPVWVQKKVDLTYQVLNKPEGLSENGLVKLSCKSITLVGEAEALEAAAVTIGNLGVFDFDHLTPDDATMEVVLNVPSGIKVLEGNTVSVALAIGGYTTKTLSYPVNGAEDVTILNKPENINLTLNNQVIPNIVICGNKNNVRRITAKDLAVTVDAAGTSGTGPVRYFVRITVPKYKDVWVYYGVNDAEAYQVYGTLS